MIELERLRLLGNGVDDEPPNPDLVGSGENAHRCIAY